MCFSISEMDLHSFSITSSSYMSDSSFCLDYFAYLSCLCLLLMTCTHLAAYWHFNLYVLSFVHSLKKSLPMTSAGAFSLLSKLASTLIWLYLVLPGSITFILSIRRLLNTIRQYTLQFMNVLFSITPWIRMFGFPSSCLRYSFIILHPIFSSLSLSFSLMLLSSSPNNGTSSLNSFQKFTPLKNRCAFRSFIIKPYRELHPSLSAGFFCRSLLIKSIAGSVILSFFGKLKSRFFIFSKISNSLAPSKGGLRQYSWYMMHPRAHRSAANQHTSFYSSSGGTQQQVPTKVAFLLFISLDAVIRCSSWSDEDSDFSVDCQEFSVFLIELNNYFDALSQLYSIIFFWVLSCYLNFSSSRLQQVTSAVPKSMILRWPFSLSKMFQGLRSRWTIPIV